MLKFDEAFYGMLRQTGAIIAIAAMWMFSKQLTEYSVTEVLFWIAVAGTVLSLPNIGLFYGLHEWTEAKFGFGARTIAIVDAATASPFAQLSMIPLLTLIAYYAPAGHRATWFALMASLMNMALVAGQLQTKYLNQIFVVGRGDYAELGSAADHRRRASASSFRSPPSCCSGGVLRGVELADVSLDCGSSPEEGRAIRTEFLSLRRARAEVGRAVFPRSAASRDARRTNSATPMSARSSTISIPTAATAPTRSCSSPPPRSAPRSTRLVTGAVLPAFNNPLKLAGEIGMLDAHLAAGGSRSASRARSCRTNSRGSASASTRAARASPRASRR